MALPSTVNCAHTAIQAEAYTSVYLEKLKQRLITMKERLLKNPALVSFAVWALMAGVVLVAWITRLGTFAGIS